VAAVATGRCYTRGLRWRFLILACLLGGEILITSLWFDGRSIEKSEGLRALLGAWGAWVLRWAVGFAGLFSTFAYLRHGRELAELDSREPLRTWMLAAHAACFGLFLLLSRTVYGPGAQGDFSVVIWIALAGSVAASAAFGLIPVTIWQLALRITGPLWAYSAAAAVAACTVIPLVRGLWQPATHTTFWMVQFILSHVSPQLVANPERMEIGTRAFRVIISPACSGLEGMGLLLVFGVVWLVVFRAELRLPQALVLLPAGMVVLYLSNSLRIAALVMLGDAGWPDIAARGFHSQAGWIAFNLVAFGLSLGARHWRWVSNRPMKQSEEEHPAAPYLSPFLAIVAAGMLAGALSGGFEWFYGLRVLACLGALFFFRREYRQVDWRGGWVGAGVGILVFGLWMAGANAPAQEMPKALAASSPALMLGWIMLRIAGGVFTVPLAEELAFRGFGLRRLVSVDFDLVPWRVFTWTSLLISSLLFGLLHGDRWLAGTVAGVFYALAMRHRGRLGDAILAHAVTNALLAFWVLWFGRWELW